MPPLNHADYQLYANQMAVLGFGLAQWDPAPHFQPVRIGDVGYTRYGGFQLLFNATDPLGDRVLGQDVPVNFEPLLVGPTVTRRRKPGVQKSAHIETRCLHANISLDNIPMNVVSAGANYSFESSVSEGAILVTKYDTKCSNAQRLGTFEKYICHYYKSWVRFANDQGHGIDVEDLLLVTGCDMTADYAMLAFTQNDRRREVRFEAGIQNIASTSASWGKWQCQFPIVYDSWGPQDHVMENVVCEGNDNAGKTQLKHNQCVFLRAFRVYRRAKLLPKVIKAGAGPHDLGSGRRHDEHPFFVGAGTSQDMDSSLDWNDDMKQHTPIQLNIPYTPELPADSAEEDTVAAIDFVEFEDPLKPLAQYLLENSHAEIALVHDRDYTLVRQGLVKVITCSKLHGVLVAAYEPHNCLTRHSPAGSIGNGKCQDDHKENPDENENLSPVPRTPLTARKNWLQNASNKPISEILKLR